jgi:hypothetical protein
MKATPEDNTQNRLEDDLLPEYHFDYSKARPNRFADKIAPESVEH